MDLIEKTLGRGVDKNCITGSIREEGRLGSSKEGPRQGKSVSFSFFFCLITMKKYFGSIICRNYEDNMGTVCRVIFLWRIHVKIDMEIVW